MPKLHTEQFGQGPSLSFIHGWGAQNSVWKPWIETHFAPHYQVTLIELPGCGESLPLQRQDNLQQAWIEAIHEVLPPVSHLIGWSLGGLLAQQIAIQSPERALSLTCLASTPRFVQTQDWPWAVSPQLLNDFVSALGKDLLATLQHFWKLQIQGSDGARQLIKHFMLQMQTRKIPDLNSLSQGLQLLKEMDNRQALQTLSLPVLWLLGENDPLIPKEFVTEFSTIQPQAHVRLISGAAHMPFYSHPEETAAALQQFINALTCP
jgi:pimeloyl-[acyl-carrier protein] methyl ester esterase